MGTHPIFESDFDCLTESAMPGSENRSFLPRRSPRKHESSSRVPSHRSKSRDASRAGKRESERFRRPERSSRSTNRKGPSVSGRSKPRETAPEVSQIDEKLRKYSRAKLSNWAAATDWMSDEFDPMAFLYTDEMPAGIDDVKPADSVEMLFARYDREDGVFKEHSKAVKDPDEKAKGATKRAKMAELKSRDLIGAKIA